MDAVLWDVDGTLLLNSASAGRLYDRAIAEVVGTEPSGRRPNEHGKTDAQIIVERLADQGLGADLLPGGPRAPRRALGGRLRRRRGPAPRARAWTPR